MQSQGTNLPIGMKWIRNVLTTNAVLCGGCGLLVLFFSGHVAAWIGWDEAALTRVTLILLGFAILLGWIASRDVISPQVVLFISILDVLWVVGCLLLLATQHSLTDIGLGLVILVALSDCIFALFEASYYWRNRRFGRS